MSIRSLLGDHQDSMVEYDVLINRVTYCIRPLFDQNKGSPDLSRSVVLLMDHLQFYESLPSDFIKQYRYLMLQGAGQKN